MTTARSEKTVAFFPAHPSQVWLLKPIAEAVGNFARCVWVVRDKDCSVQLADAFGLEYSVISKASRGLFGNALELGANIVRCLRLTKRHRIDLWVTKYGSGNMAAFLSRKRSVSYTDDDIDLIPLAAWTSYPFADATLVTEHTRMGRFEQRAIRYPGVGELAYLHPNRFTPAEAVRAELGLDADERFAIVRMSALQAHHDRGIRGIGPEFIDRLNEVLEGRVRLFISSEKPLVERLEPFRFSLPFERMPHALACAEFFVGDGQTMATEAAVLGTPSFRINDFVGRVSSIANVERYGLSFGFTPDDKDRALEKVAAVLRMPDRDEEFARRRQQFLDDCIDPVPWCTTVIRMLLDGAARTEIQSWSRRNLPEPCHTHGSVV